MELKLFAVNPLPETGLISFSDPQSVKGILGIKANLSDLFLQVKINGDMALLKAILNILLERRRERIPAQFSTDRFYSCPYHRIGRITLSIFEKYTLEALSEKLWNIY